ncbi:MAG: RHS repeat protein, partial [bacterium]|nr:RHS repeat protein [bacterium]
MARRGEGVWRGIGGDVRRGVQRQDHEYDALNRKILTTNRLGDAMSMAYDLNDNLTKSTDFEGRVTTYVYDGLNRQTEIHMPALDGQEVNIIKTYKNEADPETNLLTETDPGGGVTTYEYNKRYKRTKRINALGGEYTWEYDKNGNLEKETDENGNYTRYEYDARDRRTDANHSAESGEIHVAHNTFDPAGNIIAVENANGGVARIEYDQWNRAWKSIDPDGFQTEAHLNGAGAKVYEKDGNAHFRTWSYDARELLL